MDTIFLVYFENSLFFLGLVFTKLNNLFMNLITKLPAIVGIALAFFVLSSTQVTHAQNQQAEQIVLGQKLNNPYTIPVMQQAYENLSPLFLALNNEFNITRSHYYIKLKPVSDIDIAAIDISNLETFDYPLDYEILNNGVYYQDPSIPKGQPTFQYTVVTNLNDVPNVNYEVLEEIYIPELTEDARDSIEIFALVNEALRITNNTYNIVFNELSKSIIIDDPFPQGIRILPARYSPQGRVRVFDRVVNDFIPIEGVKVIAQNWFDWGSSTTDSNGYYFIKQFRFKINYKIKWEEKQFDVRSGAYGQAVFIGPTQTKSPWNADANGGVQEYYGHIFRGAHDYYKYYASVGVKRPPLKSTPGTSSSSSSFRSKLKIAAHADAATSVAFPHLISPLGILPNVAIHSYNLPSDQIYSTTVHEISHVTHQFYAGNANYALVECRLRETWSYTIEYYFTIWKYNQLRGSTYNFYSSVNRQRLDENLFYTTACIDLIDNEDQSVNAINPIQNTPTPCKCGGFFDSNNCQFATAPNGSTPKIVDGANNGNFVYTPVNGTCPLGSGNMINGDCLYMNIPNGCKPFIYGQYFYTRRFRNTGVPEDWVSGYSISQIEETVYISDGFTTLGENLKSRYTNPTEQFVDDLLDQWEKASCLDQILGQ
ncbi:MAG: hypothetical protein ACJAZ3_000952 [Sphingobacteriales bacterium]